MAKKTIGNLALAGFDDIFAASTAPQVGEQIEQIAITELFTPEEHPFQVNDDEAMARLVESVKEYGVREPGIARKRAEGGSYELLCGNRRKRACELAEIAKMPVIVRELDDDTAAIVMVDSNLEQRERLLPSEKAWAYRVKMEALNHNGIKGEQHSFEVMTMQTGESKNQIFRQIRLTELVPDLLDKVDARQLAFNPAVELSYLSRKEQKVVVDCMAKYEIKPSLSQAVRLKKLKKAETLTEDAIDKILSEEKKEPQGANAVTKFRNLFPKGYTAAQMEEVIVALLQNWRQTVAT